MGISANISGPISSPISGGISAIGVSAPTGLIGATILSAGNLIFLSYSTAVTGSIAFGGFSVTLNGSNNPIVSSAGNNIIAVTNSITLSSDIVDVTYVAASGNILDDNSVPIPDAVQRASNQIPPPPLPPNSVLVSSDNFVLVSSDNNVLVSTN